MIIGVAIKGLGSQWKGEDMKRITETWNDTKCMKGRENEYNSQCSLG